MPEIVLDPHGKMTEIPQTRSQISAQKGFLGKYHFSLNRYIFLIDRCGGFLSPLRADAVEFGENESHEAPENTIETPGFPGPAEKRF